MSTKERIQIVREAIADVKAKVAKAASERRLVEMSNLMLDLGALERCLEIEVDIAVKALEDRIGG
jgi:hypothetical protein